MLCFKEMGARMKKILIFSGRGNPELARETARLLRLELGRCRLEDFPDDELRVEIQEDVHGKDVYLFQPVSPPVASRLLELLLLADACRRGGAGHVTGIIPYYGYARQDRRVKSGEPVSARLVADLLSTRFERIVTVDLHNPAIEGFFNFPLENLSCVPLLAEAIRPFLTQDTVIVAPDLGAVKLAQEYADLLHLPVAYIHKERQSGQAVRVRRVIGETRGRPVAVVDDLISTGATLAAAVNSLLQEKCLSPVIVAASHSLLVGDAVEKLSVLPLRKIFVTDSIHQEPDIPLPLEVVSIKRILSDSIRRFSSGISTH
jgi:ribose-phosphate pyrophosphokinase